MLVLGWIDPSRDLELILLDLILDVRRRDFGLYYWRSHWHLARFYHQRSRLTESQEQYAAARRFLEDLIETLENEEQRDGFRGHPGPRRFLAEGDA
jgi:hypothetical protein